MQALASLSRATHDVFFMSGVTLAMSASFCTDEGVIMSDHRILCDGGYLHRFHVIKWHFLEVRTLFFLDGVCFVFEVVVLTK